MVLDLAGLEAYQPYLVWLFVGGLVLAATTFSVRFDTQKHRLRKSKLNIA